MVKSISGKLKDVDVLLNDERSRSVGKSLHHA